MHDSAWSKDLTVEVSGHGVVSHAGSAVLRLLADAAVPMEALTDGLDLFWSAYRAAIPDSAGERWAERCLELAAVRLVHIGFEITQGDLGLRRAAVLHLQVASNILDDPLRAGRDLLRLG